ncbi:hypothetical protein, conserved [Leishmania donovani]|uniref:Uncharacterized protein n=1 Tax=Leishmania donovani TaxID=5661 RepID=E9BPH9_LEIDO|nr:hypothetical protein, conserved [Leishmania donovani]CBZ37383.1 hypothetical protein, conserved [Leishmania donovani]
MSGLLGFREESPAVEVPIEDDISYNDSASQSSYTTSHSRSSSGSVYSTSTSATDNEAYQNLKLELAVAQENILELHQKYQDLERTSTYAKGQLENEIDILRLQLQRLKDEPVTSDEHATRPLGLEAAKAAADARVQELEAAAASSAEVASRLAAEHAEHVAGLEAAKAAADARVQELESSVAAVAEMLVKEPMIGTANCIVENKVVGKGVDEVVLARELQASLRQQLKQREAARSRLMDEVRELKAKLAAADAEKVEIAHNREVVEREVRRRAEATELTGLLAGQESGPGSRTKRYRSWCPACTVM